MGRDGRVADPPGAPFRRPWTGPAIPTWRRGAGAQGRERGQAPLWVLAEDWGGSGGWREHREYVAAVVLRQEGEGALSLLGLPCRSTRGTLTSGEKSSLVGADEAPGDGVRGSRGASETALGLRTAPEMGRVGGPGAPSVLFLLFPSTSKQ